MRENLIYFGNLMLKRVQGKRGEKGEGLVQWEVDLNSNTQTYTSLVGVTAD